MSKINFLIDYFIYCAFKKIKKSYYAFVKLGKKLNPSFKYS